MRFFAQAGHDGEAAQHRLRQARALVLGGGVIGSHALALLADSGLGVLRIPEGGPIEERDLAGHALWRAADVGRGTGAALSERLKERQPTLQVEQWPLDPLDPGALQAALKGCDCALICLDAPAPALLNAVNEAALRTKTRWLAGQIYRGAGIVGPTVIPHQSPCYKCYELRRNVNLNNYEETLAYEARLDQLPRRRSECIAPRPLASLVASLLALETVRLLTGVCFPQLVGRIWRIDFFAPEMAVHRLLRLPLCPACGYGRQRQLPLLGAGLEMNRR